MSQPQNFTDPYTYLFSEDREIAKANLASIDYKKAYQVEHSYTYFRVEYQSKWHHQSRVLFTKIVYLLTAKLLSDYAWCRTQVGLTYRDHRIVYEQLQEYGKTFPELTLGPDDAMSNVIATVESTKTLAQLLPQCREILLLINGTGGVTPALAASIVLDGFSKALKAYTERGGANIRFSYVPKDEQTHVLARKIKLVQDYLWNEVVGNVPFVTLSPTGECLVDFADWSEKYLETFKFLRQRQTHKLKPFAYPEFSSNVVLLLDPNAFLEHEELALHKSVDLANEEGFNKLIDRLRKADPELFSATQKEIFEFTKAKGMVRDYEDRTSFLNTNNKESFANLVTDGHELYGVEVPFELTQRFVDIQDYSERDNYLAFAQKGCRGSHVITASLAPILASADEPAQALADFISLTDKKLGFNSEFDFERADAKIYQELIFRKKQDQWLLPEELNYLTTSSEESEVSPEAMQAYEKFAACQDAGFGHDHLSEAIVQLRALFHTFGEHYPGITKPNLHADAEKTILAVTLNGEVIYQHRTYTPDFFTKDPDNEDIDLFRGTVIHFDYVAQNGWHVGCWLGFNFEGMKPKLLNDYAHNQPHIARMMGADFLRLIRHECPVLFSPARDYYCFWDALYLCKRVEGHLYFWHWEDQSKCASTLDAENLFSWRKDKFDLKNAPVIRPGDPI